MEQRSMSRERRREIFDAIRYGPAFNPTENDMNSMLGKPSGLRSVAAFWQNDKPNGMGVTIRTSDEFVVEFMDMMSDTLEICDRGWQGEADKQSVASDL